MFNPLDSDWWTVRLATGKLVALLVALGVDIGVVGLAAAKQLLVEPVAQPLLVTCGPPCQYRNRSKPAEPPWPDIRNLTRSPIPWPPAPPPSLPPWRPQPPRPTGDQPLHASNWVDAPTLIKGSTPQIPRLARKVGLQGVVILEVIIDQNGNVTDSRVLRDLGMGCGDSARAAVQGWKFLPARLDGRPISVYQIVTVRFER